MTLSKEQLDHFKNVLLQMRSQLLSSLKQVTSEVKTPDQSTGYSQHQADQGTDDFDRTIALELTSSEFATLHYVERALQKFDEETYGICDITQQEIPLKRLQAMPYATTTVEGQRLKEEGKL